jgi:tetratricopeptide (TPR) repeat protein
MSEIWMTLRRWFAGPLALLSSPFSLLGETFSQSERGRTFVLGLPALFSLFAGVALLFASQVGRQDRLVSKYDDLAKRANLDGNALIDAFRKAQRLLELEQMKGERNANASSTPTGTIANAPRPELTSSGSDGTEEKAAGPDKVETKAELEFRKASEALMVYRNAEHLYLRKLMQLKPDDEDFRFRFATSHYPQDPNTGLELISLMAPLESESGSSVALGYAPAHLWMAQWHATRPKTSQLDAQRAILLVDRYATKCLTLEPQEVAALQWRAQSLLIRNELGRAHDDYSKLFREDPSYFAQLVEINKKLGREESNVEILGEAAGRLQSQLTLERDNTRKWESVWQSYAFCMMSQGQFNELRRELESQKVVYATDQPRKAFLDRILSGAFTQRLAELLTGSNAGSSSYEEAMAVIEASREAEVMTDSVKYFACLLARLEPSLATRCSAAYDPEQDANPPGMVLSELSIAALQRQDYQKAIGLLERARSKMPESPMILNNLAYAYLQAETSSPDRALLLVDQAIRIASAEGVNNTEISQFLHTRGTALMQLNRLDEARGAFLEALAGRPENIEIIESLVKCCEGSDELQAEVFRKKLRELKGEAVANPDPATGGGSTPAATPSDQATGSLPAGQVPGSSLVDPPTASSSQGTEDGAADQGSGGGN